MVDDIISGGSVCLSIANNELRGTSEVWYLELGSFALRLLSLKILTGELSRGGRRMQTNKLPIDHITTTSVTI